MNNTNNREEESINDQLFDWVKNIAVDLPNLNKKMEEAIKKQGKNNGSDKCIQDAISN